MTEGFGSLLRELSPQVTEGFGSLLRELSGFCLTKVFASFLKEGDRVSGGGF